MPTLHPTPRRRRATIAAAGLLALALPACGLHQGRDYSIGFKRVALDLAFKDQTKGPAPTPTQILTPEPVPALANFVTQISPSQLPTFNGDNSPTVLATTRHPIDPCPKAPPNSFPSLPARVFITQAPAAGLYTTHNFGTFSLTGVLNLKAGYPKVGVFEIRNIGHSSTSDAVNGPTDIITYDVITHGVDGSTTTTSYQILNRPSSVQGQAQQTAGTGQEPTGELDLTKLVIVNSQGTVTFNPTPPVAMMVFSHGEGTSWNSAGIDQATGTAMVVQGQITQRARVDVCGTVYDTYEVQSTERITNLQTGLSYTTAANDPNIYDFATQYGGVIIHEHIDTQTTYPTSSGGAVVLNVNYDQTVNSITPEG